MDAKTKEYIDYTIEQTIIRSKMNNIFGSSDVTQRVEAILQNRSIIQDSTDPKVKSLNRRLNKALKEIQDDPYFGIIPMIYDDGLTIEHIANNFSVDIKTVYRNKKRLLDHVKIRLFTVDFIKELYS